MNILCPLAAGSGASIVHKMLEERLSDYRVCRYHPNWTLFPPSLYFKCRQYKNPDLIHAPPDYATFFSNRKSKLVITFHSFVWDRETQQYSTPLQRLHHQSDLRLFVTNALKKADMVTSVSEFTSKLIRSEFHYQKPIKVIYNGIDTSEFTPRPRVTNGHIRVLFSGNLTKRKGAHFLPQIAKNLNTHIHIAYTSGLRTSDRLPVRENLIDLGHIPYPRMPEAYRNSDILVFPSVREGFGLAVAEAMACGLPVVASNSSAIPELIEHGRGGYLCEVGNVGDFAEKINTLAANPALRKQMGEFNRKRAESHFTVERMVEEYRVLFQDLISSK